MVASLRLLRSFVAQPRASAYCPGARAVPVRSGFEVRPALRICVDFGTSEVLRTGTVRGPAGSVRGCAWLNRGGQFPLTLPLACQQYPRLLSRRCFTASVGNGSHPGCRRGRASCRPDQWRTAATVFDDEPGHPLLGTDAQNQRQTRPRRARRTRRHRHNGTGRGHAPRGGFHPQSRRPGRQRSCPGPHDSGRARHHAGQRPGASWLVRLRSDRVSGRARRDRSAGARP